MTITNQTTDINSNQNKNHRLPSEVVTHTLRFIPFAKFQQVGSSSSQTTKLLGKSLKVYCMESPVYLEQLRFNEFIPPFEIFKPILETCNNSPMGLLMKFENSMKYIHLPNHKKVVEYLLKDHYTKIGKAVWEKHFGSIKDQHVPPIPKKLLSELMKNDPHEPEKLIGQTHTLFLAPQQLNGKPLDLPHLQKLVKESGPDNILEFNDNVSSLINLNSVKKSRWVLFRKNYLPGSFNKNRYEQDELIQNTRYEAPKAFDGLIFNLINYVRGVDTFQNQLNHPILCKEEILKSEEKGRVIIDNWITKALHLQVYIAEHATGSHQGLVVSRNLD